jgi:2-dehydropantoate 2-reductase
MSRRYVIYGAGAIGGVIGGSLALAGHEVVLIARGPHLDALRAEGLTLHRPDGTHQIAVTAVGHPADASPTSEDMAILAVKSQDTEAALEALDRCGPPGLAVVCAQNGVDNERAALRRFERVYAMSVLLPAAHLEPGVVEGSGSPVLGVLDVGRYPLGVDDRAEALAADLESAQFRSRANPRIMRHKYAKLRINTANAIDAASGPAHRDSDLARQAAEEAAAVFEAAGIEVATSDEVRQRRGDMRAVEIDGRPRVGSSSWQSLARGQGRIEADHLNGEIVLLGRFHRIATPVNEALRRTANRMAVEGLAPGSIPLAEIQHLVDNLHATT